MADSISMTDEGVCNGSLCEDDTSQDDTSVCSIDRYMLPVKFAYFFNVARREIETYFMLFFVSLGFNAAEAGVISGLQYIGGMVGAPVWGFVADKFKVHRVLIIILCVMAAITTCLQPFLGIPSADKYRYKCPFKANETLRMNHGEYSCTNRHHILYYTLLITAIVGKSFDASAASFVDSGCLQRIQSAPKNVEFGQQRYIGSLGVGFGGMVYSLAITYYPYNTTSCESGIFIVYFGLLIFLGFSCYFLFKGIAITTTDNHAEDVSTILKDTLKTFDTFFFFACVLFGGIAQASFFNFLFLRLRDLKAPTLIFGCQTVIIAVSGSFVYYFSTSIIKFLGGTLNAICCSCFMWALRFLYVSFLTNPYLLFPIELFHGFTYSLFINSAFVHVNEVSHPSILTSMCGIVNSLYMELGSLIANMVGGKFYHLYGGRVLFIACSTACATWGMLMLCYILIKRIVKKGYQPINNDCPD